ncbi:hypothetical protein JCM10207_004999 [Rhodosporidiobolus poonsookiae]
MSGRSPKALLPSSLSLSSISRALPAHSSSSSPATRYSVRTVCLAATKPGEPSQPAAFVVVRQQRTPGARSSGRTAPGQGPRAGTTSSTARGGQRDAGGLLRTATGGSNPQGRTLAGYLAEQPSASRHFHSAQRSQHQHAVSPASGGDIPCPPGGSGAGSGSPPTGSAAEGHAFQPKHHSSLATPSSPAQGDSSGADGLLLQPSTCHSSHGSSVPSSIDPSSSSSPSASTSQSSQQPSSSSLPPATLFSTPPPPQLPSHTLPSFFGSALSIARRSNLVFRNGAYGIPKPGSRASASLKGKERALMPPEMTEPEHYLSVGVGEDAYFLRSDSLGVADGVGGWSGHAGANSARWARKFMHHCSAELARFEDIDDELFVQYYDVDPADVMQRAYEKTLTECREEGTIGSSTALLAVLRNDELRLANLGDCSCCVIRGDSYVFRSEEQQHQFNFPFQAGTNAKDTPAKDAQRFTVKVKRDDIVILSSDGLVDNVFSDDLLEEVLRFVGTHQPLSTPPPPSSTSSSTTSSAAASSGPRFTLRRFSPQAVSEALCFRAKSVYEDQRAVASPFQQRAMEEGIHYAGGKMDDVSCLVGVVGELEAAPNRRDVN